MLKRSTISLSGLHGLLKCLHKPFNFAIWSRIIYGAARMCQIPLALTKLANLRPMNCGPLPDTNWSVKPQDAKMQLRTTIVSSTVVDFIEKISDHLECASIPRKTILP